MVAYMDDFDVVLGIELLLAHHVIPMPAISYLMIMGGDLCVVIVQNNSLRRLGSFSPYNSRRV